MINYRYHLPQICPWSQLPYAKRFLLTLYMGKFCGDQPRGRVWRFTKGNDLFRRSPRQWKLKSWFWISGKYLSKIYVAPFFKEFGWKFFVFKCNRFIFVFLVTGIYCCNGMGAIWHHQSKKIHIWRAEIHPS